ncbi:Uncharacterised protein [Bordetella pertussis]|nr:Uncharacterised protein [Bordetella pertussis]
MPRRNAITHTTKISPMTMVTDSPRRRNQSRPVRRVSIWPKSPTLFSSSTTMKAPRIGPVSVPRPPIRVMRMTSPDICQVASDSVAETNTSVLVAPARPAMAADSTKATSLKRSTS